MGTFTSRRNFLRGSGAALLGAAAGTTRMNNAQSISPGNPETIAATDYWQMIRSQFAFSESTVPMNAANLCPSFRAVAENVARLTEDIDYDCSSNNRAKFADLLETSRSLVADQLNVGVDEIALVRNTSEANNIVNSGLQLTSGDEIMLWNQNHPTNNVAWHVRAARYGLNVRSISTPESPDNSDQLLNAFTDQFNTSTRVLALTYVSNVSGVKLPVAEIVAAAKARGIYVHVDGAQVWGAMNLDLRDLGADSFTASAHKWYMGPKEVGILYVKRENISRIWPSVVAPGWGNDVITDLPGARKFESLGQRDDAALAALGVATRLHNQIGADRIEQRIVHLSQRLKEGVSELGLTLVTPMDPALSFGVCIVKTEPGKGGEIANRLYNEHGIAAAATGGLRLCPTIYNTQEHVDRALAGIKAIMT